MNTSFFSVRNSVVAIVVFMLVAGSVFGMGGGAEGQQPCTQCRYDCECPTLCGTGSSCVPKSERREGIDVFVSCQCSSDEIPTSQDTSQEPVVGTCPDGKICNPISSTDFEDLLNGIIRWLTIFATPVLTLMIVYAGFLYTTSGGSATQTEKAKSVIKHAVIGFLLIGLAYTIKSIVGSIF